MSFVGLRMAEIWSHEWLGTEWENLTGARDLRKRKLTKVALFKLLTLFSIWGFQTQVTFQQAFWKTLNNGLVSPNLKAVILEMRVRKVFHQPGLASGLSGPTLGRSRLMQTIAADLNLGALNLEILKQNNEQRLWAPFLGPDRCSLRAVARYGGPHFEAFEA